MGAAEAEHGDVSGHNVDGAAVLVRPVGGYQRPRTLGSFYHEERIGERGNRSIAEDKAVAARIPPGGKLAHEATSGRSDPLEEMSMGGRVGTIDTARHHGGSLAARLQGALMSGRVDPLGAPADDGYSRLGEGLGEFSRRRFTIGARSPSADDADGGPIQAPLVTPNKEGWGGAIESSELYRPLIAGEEFRARLKGGMDGRGIGLANTFAIRRREFGRIVEKPLPMGVRRRAECAANKVFAA